MASVAPLSHRAGSGKPFEVLIVDDSAVIRGMIHRWLETEPTIKVVGSAANGKIAITEAKKLQPDIVLLDIEMPVMDGMTALPLLKAALPHSHVVMASTLTTRNADISLQAMRLGATDYIPKPESRSELSAAETFKNAVIAKIIALGTAKRQKLGEAVPSTVNQSSEITARASGRAHLASSAARSGTVSLAARPTARRTGSAPPPQILAIGSSTGGPQALFKVFEMLKPSFTLPIVITQHMPATFTAILATHLGKISGRKCVEAESGMVIESNSVYVAPGGKHMLLRGTPAQATIKLTKDPEENYCRPAVDPMYRSAADVYGAHVLGLILTGMGSDGCKGCKVLRDAGGQVIVQDEATSTVWGMPGSVSKAGLADKVLPLDQIADAVMRSTRKY